MSSPFVKTCMRGMSPLVGISVDGLFDSNNDGFLTLRAERGHFYAFDPCLVSPLSNRLNGLERCLRTPAIWRSLDNCSDSPVLVGSRKGKAHLKGFAIVVPVHGGGLSIGAPLHVNGKCGIRCNISKDGVGVFLLHCMIDEAQHNLHSLFRHGPIGC